jgi:hypothetical protein
MSVSGSRLHPSLGSPPPPTQPPVKNKICLISFKSDQNKSNKPGQAITSIKSSDLSPANTLSTNARMFFVPVTTATFKLRSPICAKISNFFIWFLSFVPVLPSRLLLQTSCRRAAPPVCLSALAPSQRNVPNAERPPSRLLSPQTAPLRPCSLQAPHRIQSPETKHDIFSK